MNKKYIILFIISFITLFLFSVSTSPLYNDFYMDDSAIFISTAESVLNGNVLYRDIFDHKGPVLFFIQILGQIIFEGKIGIFIIQVISLFIALIFINKTLNLINKNSKNIISILFGLVFFVYTMEEGNTSEELSLPFISICYYLFFKCMCTNKEEKEIPILYTIIYAVIFSIVVMMKLTNAIVIAILVICLTALLIKNKQYKEIFKCGIYFILGMMIVVVPICYYFYKNNTIAEMIYATFTHNFLYIKNATVGNDFISKCLYCLPVVISMIGAFNYRRKNKDISIIFVFTNVVSMFLLCVGRGLQHYFVILVPSVIIGIYMMFSENEIEFTKLEKMIIKFAGIIIVIALLYHRIWYNILVLTNIEDLKYKKLDSILNTLENKENTLMFCCPAETYLYTNIIPNYKYSFTQDNSIMSSELIEKEILEDIDNKKIENIVVVKDFIDMDIMKNIKNIISKNYTKVDEYNQKIINLKNNLWVIDELEILIYKKK